MNPLLSTRRRETLQVLVGRLHVEVRPFGRADEALPEAHGGQAVPVPRLRTQLFPIRPPGSAQEAPPPGVRDPPEIRGGGLRRRPGAECLTLDCTTSTCGMGFEKSWPYTLDSGGETFLPVQVYTLSPHWPPKVSRRQSVYHENATHHPADR